MIEFAPFFEINLAHDYYGDQRPPIQFEPDLNTQRLGARPDLRFRLSAGKLQCFVASDRQDLTLLAEQQKADRLESLALKIAGLKTAAGSLPDAAQQLTSLEETLGKVTPQDERLNFTFRLRPQDSTLFSVTEAVASAATKIVVLDLTPDSSAPQDGEALISAANMRALKIENFGLDDLITALDVSRPPLAILNVEIDVAAKNIIHKVRFGSVKRHWIYHILCSDEDVTFTIKDTKGDIEFNALAQPKQANGILARSYKSNLPIAELYTPPARFELLSDGPSGPKTVLPVLPSPSMGSAVRDGTQLSSEIYVNLW